MAEHLRRLQARRSFLRLTATTAFGLALAACEIVPAGPGAQPEPATRPQSEPKAERPAPPKPGETRHKVAVLVPLTGANAGVGSSIANAARLALADARGERIDLTVYDTNKGAAAVAAQALADGNRLFLGPLLATDVRAVAPVARRADVPVVAFSNDITVAGDGVYIMGFNPGQSIERVVSYARSQGLRRFAGLIPEGDYGQRAAQALDRAAGGRLVGTQRYDRTPAALRSAAIRLNAQGPFDAVLIADNAPIAVSGAATIRSGPSAQARILGTELWRSETSLANAPVMRGAWFASVPDAMFDQLRTRYRARYGRMPHRLGSLGYDAVLLAVRVANDWEPGRPFPAKALRDEEGFMGVDGAFRFEESGIAERQLEVLEVRPGGFVTVSPAARSFGR